MARTNLAKKSLQIPVRLRSCEAWCAVVFWVFFFQHSLVETMWVISNKYFKQIQAVNKNSFFSTGLFEDDNKDK